MAKKLVYTGTLLTDVRRVGAVVIFGGLSNPSITVPSDDLAQALIETGVYELMEGEIANDAPPKAIPPQTAVSQEAQHVPVAQKAQAAAGDGKNKNRRARLGD